MLGQALKDIEKWPLMLPYTPPPHQLKKRRKKTQGWVLKKAFFFYLRVFRTNGQSFWVSMLKCREPAFVLIGSRAWLLRVFVFLPFLFCCTLQPNFKSRVAALRGPLPTQTNPTCHFTITKDVSVSVPPILNKYINVNNKIPFCFFITSLLHSTF